MPRARAAARRPSTHPAGVSADAPGAPRGLPLGGRALRLLERFGDCGRALGGSSAVNGAYLVRPTTQDLRDLAAEGGPLWSVDATTAACARYEDDADLGAAPGHGDAGPVPVARTPAARYHPVSAAVTAAALAAGHPAEPDLNAPGAHGVGPVPLTVRDGVRVNLGLAAAVPAVLRLVQRSVLGRWRATGEELYREVARLTDLLALARLRWLVVARPREIAAIPWLIPSIGAVISEARFGRFAATNGIDPPTPMSTGSTPHASVKAARAWS